MRKGRLRCILSLLTCITIIIGSFNYSKIDANAAPSVDVTIPGPSANINDNSKDYVTVDWAAEHSDEVDDLTDDITKDAEKTNKFEDSNNSQNAILSNVPYIAIWCGGDNILLLFANYYNKDVRDKKGNYALVTSNGPVDAAGKSLRYAAINKNYKMSSHGVLSQVSKINKISYAVNNTKTVGMNNLSWSNSKSDPILFWTLLARESSSRFATNPHDFEFMFRMAKSANPGVFEQFISNVKIVDGNTKVDISGLGDIDLGNGKKLSCSSGKVTAYLNGTVIGEADAAKYDKGVNVVVDGVDSVPDNSELTSLILTKKLNENDYPTLCYVRKKLLGERIYNDLEANYKINSGNTQQSNSNLTTTVQGFDVSSWDDLKKDGNAYKAWSMLISNFFRTGHTKITEEDLVEMGIDDAFKKELFKELDLNNYGIAYAKGFYSYAVEKEEDRLVVSGQVMPNGRRLEEAYVTPYEDLKLRIYFNTLLQYMNWSTGAAGSDIDSALNDSKNNLKVKFAIQNRYDKEQAGDEVGAPNYLFVGQKKLEDNVVDIKIPNAEEEAKQAVNDGFKGIDGVSSPNAKITAQNFAAIMKYLAYGVIDTQAMSGAYSDSSNNTFTIPYSEDVAKIIPELTLDGSSSGVDSSDSSTYLSSTNIDFSAFGIPDIPNLNRVGNTKFNINKFADVYMSLMFIKQYAMIPRSENADGNLVVSDKESDMSGLKWAGGETEISSDTYKKVEQPSSSTIWNEKLETAVQEYQKLTSEEDKKKYEPTVEVGQWIRAYCQIHDGIDYIGLDIKDEWISPELKVIYNYYDKIKDMQDNVSSDKYNPAGVEEQPFPEFFKLTADDTNGGSRTFSEAIDKGIAASATYLPLITNTFDYDSIKVVDDDKWVQDFHYKYGFHRKALFIDTNSSAALSSYVTGQKDQLKVATLEDMMNPEKDIVLYVDTNFYNVKSLAEKQNLSYNKLQNTEEADKQDAGLLQGVADMWSEWRNLDAASICKTAGQYLYSEALANADLDPYGVDKNANNFWKISSKNHYVLSSDAIDTYYKADEYSDTQSFAFTSGIYRCKQLLSICQNQSKNPKPVFVSSPTLPFVNGVNKRNFNSIYNYVMVKNLCNNLGLDYKTELDLDSPLFIDVYGNITTQSGLVVIPAASNATFYEQDAYSVVTAGFASLAASTDAWQIPADKPNVADMIDNSFIVDVNTNTYKLSNKTTEQNVSLNFTNLNLQSESVRKVLYNDALTTCSGGIDGNNTFEPRVNMIMEVMRGAPIENIDFEQEGLSGYRNLDRTGIYIAYRVEQLGDLLLSSSEGNSLLKMPNLAFMSGIEYIVVIVFKCLLAATLFLLWFKLYADGMSNNLGWRTGFEFMSLLFSVVVGILFIPQLLGISYYQTNKQLLQNEASYLMLLNTEKNQEGKEVGVKEVREPSSTTKFYIKLDEVKVPWWTVISDIYSSDMFSTMKDVYDKAFSESIYSTFDGAEKHGNGIYVNIDDVFDSSEIRFAYDDGSGGLKVDDSADSSKQKDKAGFLYQVVQKDAKLSYVIPYYAIIDKVLYDAQQYNRIYSSAAYRTKVLQNGNVRTIGLLEPYFKSNRFLQSDEQNLFGFYDIYGMDYSTDFRENIWNQEESSNQDYLTAMRSSLWYNKDAFTDKEIEAKLQKLDYMGKKFIVDNRQLLNKVTDETFLKVFALYMSVQHNNLFKVPAARGVELMEIDTKDIIRLSLAPRSQVMRGISMSFGRFTYTQAGTFGTILMIFLLFVYYVTSLIKPTVMIILVGALIFSYVFKKLMRYEQNHSLEGYIVSCALICLVNLIYALFMKITVMLPDFGADPTFSIIFNILLQFAYAVILYIIGYTVLRNVRDIGFFTYKTYYDTHIANHVNAAKLQVDRVISKSIFAPMANNYNQIRNNMIGNRHTAGLTGDDIYDRMHERDEERRQNVIDGNRRRR